MRPGALFVPSAFVVALFVASAAQAQPTLYVDPDSPYDGPGDDWEHAYHFLQNALAVVGSGDEIQVAEGIYRPDDTTADPNGTGDRTATFQLISGVAIYGGYAGYGQPDPDERDIDTYVSNLSGDLDENDGPGPFDNNDENSYHVTTGSGTDDTAVLDGFIVSGGNADEYDVEPHNRGAGMYNDGGSPTLTQCTFHENSSLSNVWGESGGAGMWSSGNPTLTSCTFSDNSCHSEYGGGGGGMYSSGDPTLEDCTFSDNFCWSWIDGGGGMWSDGSPTLRNCTFNGNFSVTDGSGMWSTGNPTLTNCTFSGNSNRNPPWAPGSGGGMDSSGNPRLTNCTFSGNEAYDGGGGGMISWSGNPTLTDCIFDGNWADEPGGGLWVAGSPTLTRCTFRENEADFAGGGMNGWGGDATLTACMFIQNYVDEEGGGLAWSGGSAKLVNCTFGGNSAGFLGGGGISVGGTATMSNCTFSGNSAWGDGGGVFTWTGDLTLTNCTIAGNTADPWGGRGGGLYCDSGSLTLANCVLWGNEDAWGTDESAQIYMSSGTPVIKYSCIQGCVSFCSNPNDHNIGEDPHLLGDGLHLSGASPCINVGDNTAVPLDEFDLDGDDITDEPLPYDIDGEERVQQCRVDMGADETPYFSGPDCNQNGTADACDIDDGTSTDFDGGGVPDECELTADIKPGACPNLFNRAGHGVLPVALLGTAYFDVTEIDVSTVRLSRADGVGTPVEPHEGPPGPHSVYDDVGTPFYGETCDCHDAAADGIDDLSVKFKSDDVVAGLLLDEMNPGALVELVVTGSLLDGTTFAAGDCVRLVPPGTPPGMAVVQSGAAGAWIGAAPLDLQLDGGGFADFERTYPLGSVVSFTAEQTYEGTRFVCWHLDGEFYSTDLSVDVTTMDDVHVLEAVMLWPGDMDGDADVDLADFAEFAVCYTGADVTAPPPGCEPCEFRGADLDGDDDVDLADFATFAVNHGG